MRAEECRHNAARCLALANQNTDPAARVRLMDMAQGWLRLSEQAEKNARNDIPYETPKRPDLEPVQ